MNEATILTGEAVQAFTGYKMRSKQCEWLRRRGYHYEINGKGQVVVVLRPEKTRRTPTLGAVK
jgi:hypothetical protein